MSSLVYRPEIDGLRAVAVVPVILFHMGYSWISGGFVGVDVFFVISGFLITSIIKKELEKNAFSLRDFWARRIRRILPAMLAVTATTLVVSYFFVFRPDQQEIGTQAIASIFSVANFYFWRNGAGDYWGASAEESPFLHAWSLSVEEQFYLFFPIAIWAIYKMFPKMLGLLISLVVVMSFCLFVWGTHNYPNATFYLLPTRAWELGAGCLLGLYYPQFQNSEKKIIEMSFLATVGLACILISYLVISSLSIGLAVPVLGTVLVIAFGRSGFCKRVLSYAIPVHIGKLSYSLYLWHWPVLVLAKRVGFNPEDPLTGLLILLTIYSLSFASFHLVERPNRRRQGAVPSILGAGVVVVGAAITMAAFPRYYDISDFKPQIWEAYNCRPEWEPPLTPKFRGIDVTNPGYKEDSYCNGGIRLGESGQTPRVVVLGDSHACMWAPAIAKVLRNENIPASFYTMAGEDPFMEVPPRIGRVSRMKAEQRLEFDEARLRDIKAWKPDLVILAARWTKERQADALALLSFTERLGISVVIIESPPLLSIGDHNAMQWMVSQGMNPKPYHRQYLPMVKLGVNEGSRGIIRELGEKFTHVHILPSYDIYESDWGALALVNDMAVYFDDDHLTPFGGTLMEQRFRNVILQFAGRD